MGPRLLPRDRLPVRGHPLQVEPSPAPALAAESALIEALDTASIEPAVYRLAAPQMEGRGRGTPGNAQARAYIVSRLLHAGLTPLFHGGFEQPTFSEHGEGPPYAVNVGAYLPQRNPQPPGLSWWPITTIWACGAKGVSGGRRQRQRRGDAAGAGRTPSGAPDRRSAATWSCCSPTPRSHPTSGPTAWGRCGSGVTPPSR